MMMPNNPLLPSLAIVAAALVAGPALAATAGYFESEVCADPSGFEQCYGDAEAQYASCVDDHCDNDGTTVDCFNVCACLRTYNELDCAGAHCWNQVYSCEYQATAGDLVTYCPDPDLESVPFYPPPDTGAPAACSCNLGKLTISQLRTGAEGETCGAHGTEIVNGLMSQEELDTFAKACICCLQSGTVSAFYDICPNTDPDLIGRKEAVSALIDDDEDWPNCAEYMDAFPCDSVLGYTPPGGDDSGHFYGPDDFPADGTATLSNGPGSITSPVNGAMYTWTEGDSDRTVTVASADATPTTTTGDDASGDGSSSDDGGSEESEDEASGSNGEDKPAAATTEALPGLSILGGLLLLSFVVAL